MPTINPGEVWMADFGLVAKVRPALLLTGNPAEDELDLVTVLLHTTALRQNRWELSIPKPFLRPGAFQARRKLGTLNESEMERVLDAVAKRFGI